MQSTVCQSKWVAMSIDNSRRNYNNYVNSKVTKRTNNTNIATTSKTPPPQQQQQQTSKTKNETISFSQLSL
jgi:hypothetical protein